MKRKLQQSLAFLAAAAILVTNAGCSLGDLTDKYLVKKETEAEEAPEIKERVYMDKLTGVLESFDGSGIVLRKDEESWYFDVSDATIECVNGLLSGDEISVIYEGQMKGSDTGSVRALKVVDELHNKKIPEEKTVSAALKNLTANTVTFTDDTGRTYTCVSTGARQYYSRGILHDLPVTIHYLGELPAPPEEGSGAVYAGLVKIVSISDVEPFAAPDLTEYKTIPKYNSPTPTPPEETEGQEPTPTPVPVDDGKPQMIRGHLKSLSLDQMQLLLSGAKNAAKLDVSEIPCYTEGGFCEETGIDIYYDGLRTDDVSMNGTTPLLAVGDDPASMKPIRIVSLVSGQITGRTADTVTLHTQDGADVILRVNALPESARAQLESGSNARIVIDPASAKESTIFTALRIEG